MQLEARDKRALIIGAAVVVLLLAYLLWPRGSEQSGVELVAADRRGGQAPAAPPMQVQPPNTMPAPPVAAPAAPAAAMPEGITLTGVAGSGAIFAFADGSQRFVSRGRQVAPGVVLQAVRLRDVILAAGPTNYRLGFGGAPVPIQPPSVSAAAPAPGAAPQLVVPGAGRNALGGPLIGEAQQREMSRAFVAGLEPRNNGGRVTGWAVKSGSNLLALQQAGLQPGDVLVAVNGEQVLDQEQVAGLPQQIANAHRVEFTFERNGQRMTRAIEVNPRR